MMFKFVKQALGLALFVVTVDAADPFPWQLGVISCQSDISNDLNIDCTVLITNEGVTDIPDSDIATNIRIPGANGLCLDDPVVGSEAAGLAASFDSTNYPTLDVEVNVPASIQPVGASVTTTFDFCLEVILSASGVQAAVSRSSFAVTLTSNGSFGDPATAIVIEQIPIGGGTPITASIAVTTTSCTPNDTIEEDDTLCVELSTSQETAVIASILDFTVSKLDASDQPDSSISAYEGVKSGGLFGLIDINGQGTNTVTIETVLDIRFFQTAGSASITGSSIIDLIDLPTTRRLETSLNTEEVPFELILGIEPQSTCFFLDLLCLILKLLGLL